MIQEVGKILWNDCLGPTYYRMGIGLSGVFVHSIPGQFVMVRLPGRLTPFLRRPFSIHRITPGTDGGVVVELLYKVVGAGTAQFSELTGGDTVDVLGPLGNGFTVADEARQVFLVAGGIGVAPLLFLAASLRKRGFQPERLSLFLGGRSSQDLLCRQDFEKLGIVAHLTTDDGTEGDQCLITHPVEVEAERRRPDLICACGPMAMLKCVAGIAEKYSVPCQISTETLMACGMGACLGCAMENRLNPDKYLHACLDGPVFEAGSLLI